MNRLHERSKTPASVDIRPFCSEDRCDARHRARPSGNWLTRINFRTFPWGRRGGPGPDCDSPGSSLYGRLIVICGFPAPGWGRGVWNGGGNMEGFTERRNLLGLGAAGAMLAAGTLLDSHKAAAQAASGSLLRTVLDRGKLIVGTGSTNPPWHFEDDKGNLTGMDIAMARILAKGLFDDVTKVDFVREDPNARIPNIATGKVDVVIQFMTISAARAQLVDFSRPYYVEGAALMTSPNSKYPTYKDLVAAGAAVRASVLQNVDADDLVHTALPQAQVMQLDTQANVMQAVTAGRADVAVVDASTVKWLVKRNPDVYTDPRLRLRGAALSAPRCGKATRTGCNGSTPSSTSPCTATTPRSTTPPSRSSSARSAAVRSRFPHLAHRRAAGLGRSRSDRFGTNCIIT